MIRSRIVGDSAGGEIDAAMRRVMDTTQIKHQHAIDEHPHIIVAGEVEHHVPIVDLAVFRHVEIGAKIHTEGISIIASIVSKWSETKRTSALLISQRESIRCFVV